MPNEKTVFQVGKKAYQISVCDHILDNVYGQIGITPVEKAIERLPIFKRLHHISQLGLVNWIFPCALHTRYTHSVGVMHVAGEMATHINKNYDGEQQPFFDDSDIQIVRLAGLLHDIGHYPMSHNVEAAYRVADDRSQRKEASLKTPLQRIEEITNYPSSIMDVPQPIDPTLTSAQIEEADKNKKLKREEKFFKAYKGASGCHHENMGSLIICTNASIFEAILQNFVLLEEDGALVLNPKFAQGKTEVTEDEAKTIAQNLLNAIAAMVRGDYDFDARAQDNMSWLDTYSAMIQLIHSELDADNLDYLLRDATFSGTSYGTMDMSVLLNCLTVAELSNISETGKQPANFKVGEIEVTRRPTKQYVVGVMSKGVGSVDQFLLNKYLAYTQMILSKYVTILEEMLLHFEVNYILPEEECNDTHYTCRNLKKLVATADPSIPYYWFSDHYILRKISLHQTTQGYSRLPEAIAKSLANLSAFDLLNGADSECICSGCDNETLRNALSRSAVYKEFLKCREKWENFEKSRMGKLEKAEKETEELELFSYHFTVYSLTKQVPRQVFLEQLPFLNMSPERRFIAHYYRLANGVPIIKPRAKYEYESFDNDAQDEICNLPDLCADSPQSCIHEMYSLQHVTLRQYKID